MSSEGADDERLGEVIDGRYRLIERLGEGAMGAVFSAASVPGGERVAIKLLRDDVPEHRRLRDRFEREAMVGSKIDHPNCAAVTDFGRTDDGRMYLAMELLEGRSLADALDAEHRFPERRALRTLRHILRGLGACHDAGVLHRDLKPENIFLHRTPEDPEMAKLVDFGIAKLMGDAEIGHEQLTSVGLILGTPAYIAPEWMSCDDVDGRADLYAAAIVLFEMLAGRPPFYSDDKTVMMRWHMAGERPRVGDVAPSVVVSSEVEELLQKGLSVDRDQRFASAAAFLHAVEQVLGIEDTAPAKPASLQKTWAMPSLVVRPATTAAGAPAAARPGSAPFGLELSRRGRMALAAAAVALVVVGASIDPGCGASAQEPAEAARPEARR